ncbi:MAG: cyclopropane-fatty-acyl-phospholipid synthase [Gammaproteobacteria bacterium RIFCSPHIGHO2_12_FULL_41_20]|nr:MAG: cyclopropane-fatty-acyl-phospholipid synthase [Gammaproteobacteria bacterium RIFCSPHIGHO2_12_FULL_41_20]
MFASMKNDLQALAAQLLQTADITINGSRQWDIQVHNQDFYYRVWQQGALGLGESYMDGWWDCPRLDMFFEHILHAHLDRKIHPSFWQRLKQYIPKLINYQSKRRVYEVGKRHYDIDNNLFQSMLDSRMIYSCGYWRAASNLEEAQQAKLDLICRKLHLQSGMTLLDVGCGWGGLAKYAAENYGVTVTGITISKNQYQYAKELCVGLPVDIQLKDYRDIQQQYDRVVSVGMFEHVGHLNYLTYMQTVYAVLKDHGLFLLHTIGNNETYYTSDEWVVKYIFPNGMLPSISQIGKASENLWVMEDWHNFGADYDQTLMAWYDNFIRHWEQLRVRFDERFYRMWSYYLLSSAGGFRAREMQLWQIIFSKQGIPGGYVAPR